MPRLGFVLGGGGMRGLAHIGALEVLAEHGITPAEMVGCSAGSYIGALAAADVPPAVMADIALRIGRDTILDFDLNGLVLRRSSCPALFKGERMMKFFRRTLPIHHFDDLPRPYYVNAVDLHTGLEVQWGTGIPDSPDIPSAVYASCALAGVFPPLVHGSGAYVDGGVVDSLPLRLFAERPVDAIVAITLETLTGTSGRRPESEGFLAVLGQARLIASHHILMDRMPFTQGKHVYFIEPKVSRYGLFEFSSAPAVLEEGRRAARAMLEACPELLRGNVVADERVAHGGNGHGNEHRQGNGEGNGNGHGTGNGNANGLHLIGPAA